MLTQLTTLIALITTVIAAVPEKCGSTHPIFTLDPINFSSYYTYTTPAASGPKLATFSFLLKNDETDYDIACGGSMSMPLGQFYGWYPAFNCTTPGNPDWKQTSFTYDSNTKLVAVNTTWDCGGDVVYATAITGKVNLKCDTTIWQNPAWKRGELYSNISTTCEPGKLSVQL